MAEALTNEIYFTRKRKNHKIFKGFYRQTISKHNHALETLNGLEMQGAVGAYPNFRCSEDWPLSLPDRLVHLPISCTTFNKNRLH